MIAAGIGLHQPGAQRPAPIYSFLARPIFSSASFSHVVQKLHDAFKKGLEDPSVVATLAKYDMVPRYLDTASYRKVTVIGICAMV